MGPLMDGFRNRTIELNFDIETVKRLLGNLSLPSLQLHPSATHRILRLR